MSGCTMWRWTQRRKAWLALQTGYSVADMIPAEDVLRRFAGRWSAVERILPYCDEAEFYDNNNGFVKVAEYRNGEVLAIGEYRPQWLQELLRQIADDFVK